MPQKRGPKQAHKLTAEVLAFLRQARRKTLLYVRRLWLRASRTDMASRFIHAASSAPWWAIKKNRSERNAAPARCRRGLGGSLRAIAKRCAESHCRRWLVGSTGPKAEKPPREGCAAAEDAGLGVYWALIR